MDIRVEQRLESEMTMRLEVLVRPKALEPLLKQVYKDIAAKRSIQREENESYHDACVRALDEERVQVLASDAIMRIAAPFARSTCKNLTTIGEPVFPQPDKPVQAGKPFRFSAIYIKLPQMELSSYEPVQIEAPDVTVTDEMVDAQIAGMLAASAEDVKTDAVREVVEGDTVDFALRISLNGHEVQQLCFDSYIYEVGSHRVPGSFDGNLVGMKPGEEKEFDFEGVTDFDSAGRPLTDMYHAGVRILSLTEKKTPELTDAWAAKAIPGCETVEKLRENIRNRMSYQLMSQNTHRLNYLAAAALAKRIEGNIPDAVYEAAHSEMRANMAAEAAKQGMTPDQFMEAQGVGSEQQAAFLMVQCRDSLVQRIALDAYARHFNLKVTEKDLDDYFAFGNPKARAAEMRKRMEETGNMYIAYENALRLKANFHLVDNAQIK